MVKKQTDDVFLAALLRRKREQKGGTPGGALDYVISTFFEETEAKNPEKFERNLSKFWDAFENLEGNIPSTHKESGCLAFNKRRYTNWIPYRIACENLVKSIETADQWYRVLDLGTNVKTRTTRALYETFCRKYGTRRPDH